MSVTESTFGFTDPFLVERLHEWDWFRQTLNVLYVGVGRNWKCDVTVSARRLWDAFSLWQDDAERAKFSPTPRLVGLDPKRAQVEAKPEILQVDYFKHTAAIAFWLRRCNPIDQISFNNINVNDVAGGSEPLSRPTEEQAHFIKYGAEFTALMAGLLVCVNYEKRTGGLGDEGLKLSARFAYEYPVLFKQKNLSLHALYMLYTAIFETARLNRPT